SQSYVLNSYFEADLDNYKKGTVNYKFSELTPGKHTVTFKVWDIFNNSSQAELNFVVQNGDNPNIQRVYNYPNPFSDQTYFFFEHNQVSENLDVTIEIFNMSGKKVREIKTNLVADGYTSGSIPWDGRDTNGNKIWAGVYIYRIILRSSNGVTISNAQKMVYIQQ
ncbi:MAG TPA: T9SS type A sorting domain-containing protein, partial [Bacteroidales bacterium]